MRSGFTASSHSASLPSHFQRRTTMQLSLGPIRSARSLAWVTATTVLVAGLLPTASAAAASTCSYTAATKAVEINLVGAVSTKVSRNAAGAILIDGTACGSATVTTTD